MKVFSTIFNWLLFLTILGVVVSLCWHRHWIASHIPERGTMTGPQVIIYALSLAFVWVEVLKWGSVKPFNCVKCLTGWFALILAVMFHVEFWYMYLAVGVFAGAMFEGIKMKWL